jgi:hypothetical protein
MLASLHSLVQLDNLVVREAKSILVSPEAMSILLASSIVYAMIVPYFAVNGRSPRKVKNQNS